jgi:hypothetical protein
MKCEIFMHWSSDLLGRAGLAVIGPGKPQNYGLIMGLICFIAVVWRRRVLLMEIAVKSIHPRPEQPALGPAQSMALVKGDEPDPGLRHGQSLADFEAKARTREVAQSSFAGR